MLEWRSWLLRSLASLSFPLRIFRDACLVGLLRLPSTGRQLHHRPRHAWMAFPPSRRIRGRANLFASVKGNFSLSTRSQSPLHSRVAARAFMCKHMIHTRTHSLPPALFPSLYLPTLFSLGFGWWLRNNWNRRLLARAWFGLLRLLSARPLVEAAAGPAGGAGDARAFSHRHTVTRCERPKLCSLVCAAAASLNLDSGSLSRSLRAARHAVWLSCLPTSPAKATPPPCRAPLSPLHGLS